MANVPITIVTVDDDTHGCYVEGHLVGTHAFLGSDAPTAFVLMARWLGHRAATLHRTPEQLAALGGEWPAELWAWSPS